MKTLITAVALAVSMLFSALQARAQQEILVEGLVQDSRGAAIEGAEVTLRRLEAGQDQRVRTDAGGRFRFSSVADGRYAVTVSAQGFAASEQRLSVAGQSATLTLSLSPAGVNEAVAVRAEIYQETAAAIGTKTEAPLIEVPQAISIINRQLLDDQGARKLDDALKNVAGVMPGGYYNAWDYYRIRGFDASFTTYIDGLMGINGVGEEMFGLERVEVLKGPSSALYGQGVLGGLVNLQSKRPRRDGFADLQMSGGSWNFYEPGVDLGGSLNPSRTLYARLTALYRTQKSFVEFAKRNRWYGAPAITWDMTPRTSITLLSRFQIDRMFHAFPLPAKGTVEPNINGELPISTFIGEPSRSNDVVEKNKQGGYLFTHRFNDDITLQQNLRISESSSKWKNLLYPGLLADDERTLYRYPLFYNQQWRTFRVDTNLTSRFQTGALRHNLITGFEFYRYPNAYQQQTIDFSDFSAFLPIDIFNPVYGVAPEPTLQPWFGGTSRSRTFGGYFQDQMKWGEKLSFTAGGRVDAAANKTDANPYVENTAFSPRVGVNYQFLSGAAVYGSYTKSFRQQSGRVFDGSASSVFADPERGRQFEVGVKTNLIDGRMTATFAAFDLVRQNVASNDPDHPNFVLMTGKQRSRGVELETSYRPTTGWNFIAAYTYIDAKVIEDTVTPIGTRTQNVPHHSISFWTTYEVERGWARGFGFGFGARRYTDQSGDLSDSFRIPSYGLADGSIFYRNGRLLVRANFNNLTDKRYFTGSYDQLYVQPGDPRNARVTIGWTF